jgi:hypothetical protein
MSRPHEPIDSIGHGRTVPDHLDCDVALFRIGVTRSQAGMSRRELFTFKIASASYELLSESLDLGGAIDLDRHPPSIRAKILHEWDHAAASSIG